MPLVPTVTADGAKICELAKQKYGTVAALAAAIGCQPNSISNLRQERVARTFSLKFATRVAQALDVPLSEITVPGETGETETPRPLAQAS
jgi:transcriptional regulator with XRE-family HTH domain